MNLFAFHGNDFFVTQTGNGALWEAAAHTRKLQLKFLQDLQGQSIFRMDCSILGMNLVVFGSILIVESHDSGPVDLVNP